MCSSALVQMCARLAPNQDWFELPRDFILRLGRLANDVEILLIDIKCLGVQTGQKA